jgi:hypothetical protein
MKTVREIVVVDGVQLLGAYELIHLLWDKSMSRKGKGDIVDSV